MSIYTPTYQRPDLLALCVASVEAQTIRGLVDHVIVWDDIGIGIGGMYAEIEARAGGLRGDYVYCLQDDDRLMGPGVVEAVRDFAEQSDRPAVIMVKNKKRSWILPSFWEARPVACHVDLGSFVVRADVFRRHCGDFGRHYAGDFDFIDAVWRAGWRFSWCDLLFAEAVALGLGRPGSELAAEAARAGG